MKVLFLIYMIRYSVLLAFKGLDEEQYFRCFSGWLKLIAQDIVSEEDGSIKIDW